MTTRVVIVGDTHLPRFGRSLPEPLVVALAAADRILHVGDHTERFVVELLAAFAPTDAVAGNNDPPDLVARLGTTGVVTSDTSLVGLLPPHGRIGERIADLCVRRAESPGGRASAWSSLPLGGNSATESPIRACHGKATMARHT